MINAQFRTYDYYSFGNKDGYGQPALITDSNGLPVVQGTIKMSINISTQSIQDNINYKDAQYIGLTLGSITDKDVIDLDGSKLKVLYVNTFGRYKQVFLKEI